MSQTLKSSSSIQFHPTLSFLVISGCCIYFANAGPLPHPYYKAPDSNRLEHHGNQSLVSKLRLGGCRYQASVYSSGDLVTIEEPCLNCQCKNTTVVCKLRICPEFRPPPPGCILVHRANKCCAQLECPENKKISREHRLSSSSSSSGEEESNNVTQLTTLPLPADENGFCVHDGTVYAEGSAMRSSSLCEHCFCIRGEMKCSSPQCLIPLDGCKPRFRSYACCPTNYDCNESNVTAIIRTPPPSTPIPEFLKGCQVSGRFLREGEPVLPLNLEPEAEINACQSCFCMGGVVRCRKLECDKPLHGCRPIKKPGHCCPDRYECPMNATAFNQVVMEALVSDQNLALPLGDADVNNDKLLTSTEIHAPLALDQNAVNEILSSRVANSLRPRQVESSPGSEPVSRDDRRNKDVQEPHAHDYVIKISRELVDGDEHTIENANVSVSNAEESEQEKSNVVPTDLVIINQDNGSNSADLAEGAEGDGSELTIALEVIADNDATTSTEETTLSPEVQAHNDDEEGSFQVTTESRHDFIAETEDAPELPSSNQSSTTVATMSAELLDEDVERTTLTPEHEVDSSTTNTSTTQEKDLEPPTHTQDSPSLTNLQFIPFGMEDVMFLHNEHSQNVQDTVDPLAPIKITFDSTDIKKANLIAPNPTAGSPSYVHVPFIHQLNRQSDIITSEHLVGVGSVLSENDSKQSNTVMDVPVSTSLYSNGYFPPRLGPSGAQNKSIFDHVFEESGEKFYEEDDDEKEEEAVNGRAGNVTTITSDLNLTSDLLEEKTQKPVASTVTTTTERPTSTHPSRIYSKFNINDSPYYTRFKEAGYDLILLPGQALFKQQQQQTAPSIDHHRYYDAPDTIEEVLRLVPPSNVRPEPTDYQENDESDLEDEEFVFYEDQEESSEKPTKPGEPSFSAKLEKVSLSSPTQFQTATTSKNESSSPVSTFAQGITGSTGRVTHVASTKKKPQYYAKTPASTIKPIVVNTPRPSAPVSSSSSSSSSTVLFSPSYSHGSGGFKPVLSFPFVPFPKHKPLDGLLHIGLKLSGCNIYGKMYGIGSIIRELSSNCIQCQCTEIGVQCREILCDGEDMIMMS